MAAAYNHIKIICNSRKTNYMNITGIDFVPMFKFIMSDEGQEMPRSDLAKKFGITIVELDCILDTIELTKQWYNIKDDIPLHEL